MNGKTGTILRFFTTLRQRRVLHLSPTCHANLCCPSSRIHVCVCMYICVYVYMCRVWILLCHACVTQTCAPLMLQYALYAPNNYLLSNPVVVVHPVCCLVQANPGPLCSSRSRYERAPPLHIPRLHIECIYCATYILCAYRSFSFSFRITLPPLRSLPVTSIVQPQ